MANESMAFSAGGDGGRKSPDTSVAHFVLSLAA
jgi:hypothetical protein